MDRPKRSFSCGYKVFGASALLYFGWQLMALQGSVMEGRQEIQALRGRIEAERGERAALEARSAELARRADDLARSIADAKTALASSGHNFGDSLKQLKEREATIEAGFSGLREQIAAAVRKVNDQSVEVHAVKHRLETVAPRSYDALLGPTVKISSKSDVGSGTVVFSQKTGRKHTSYILTAHHIVEQNYDALDPIPLDVISFREGNKVREERGIVVAVNPKLDLALIEVQSDRGYEAVAKLIPADRIPDVKLYSRVSAMGCPLGYAPTPTSGELTSKSKILEDQSYWMINAPTIFGNSGGGIYLSETGEMIGVLSRISAYKNLIDVAVPHMGIITSMGDVYGWLERENYTFIVDAHYTAEDCNKARLAERKANAAATDRSVPESTAVAASKEK